MNRIAQLTATGVFDARVPRYTSYPTAPHFSDKIGPAETERWVRELPAEAPVSLYLHIPFCERLCWFCACRTQGVRSAEPVIGYVDTLLQEIRLLEQVAGRKLKISRMHWGGGTPTILPPALIRKLSESLREAFDFTSISEFSVEIDPTLVDGPKLAALAEAGMTRASIGIQDFDPSIQQAIGRIQTVETTAKVVRALRAQGITSLNTDIVYGLPGQTLESIRKSTEQVLELAPDRVALFGYAHVPWVAKRQRMIDADTLPDPIERLELVEQTERQFVNAGYVPLGIDHFALPGDSMTVAARKGELRRNFQGYTDDIAPALIGLGASSVSRYPQGYAQNAGATASYTARIREGRLATAKGYALRLEDRVRAAFIERFLCDLSVDMPALEAEFGNFIDLLRPDIDRALSRFGKWLHWNAGKLELSEEGKPLARLIATLFDAFYEVGEARHSSAI